MNDSSPVSHAKPPLPHYAPVCLHDQARELRKQLAITRNVLDRKVACNQLHPGLAAAELQCLQSALNTIEAIEAAVGPNTILTPDELRQRLQPEVSK